MTVWVLGGWSPDWPLDQLVACTGSRELTVVGYLAPAWGIGGIPTFIKPAWLGEEFIEKVLWLKVHPSDGCFADDDCRWIFLFAEHPETLPLEPDRWVVITGHFDDPAAATCYWEENPISPPRTTTEAIGQCRQHFVVTEMADASPPD